MTTPSMSNAYAGFDAADDVDAADPARSRPTDLAERRPLALEVVDPGVLLVVLRADASLADDGPVPATASALVSMRRRFAAVRGMVRGVGHGWV